MIHKWVLFFYQNIFKNTFQILNFFGEETCLDFDQLKEGAKQFKCGGPGPLQYRNQQEAREILKDIALNPNRPIALIVEHVNPHVIAVIIARDSFERSYVKFFSNTELLAVITISKDQKSFSAAFLMSQVDPDLDSLATKLAIELLVSKRLCPTLCSTKPHREFQVLYDEDGSLKLNQVPKGHIKFPRIAMNYMDGSKTTPQ